MIGIRTVERLVAGTSGLPDARIANAAEVEVHMVISRIGKKIMRGTQFALGIPMTIGSANVMTRGSNLTKILSGSAKGTRMR